MFRKIMIGFLLLVLIALAVFVYLVSQYKAYLNQPVAFSEKIKVSIPKGTKFQWLLKILEKNKVITRPLYFRIYSKLRNVHNSFKGGIYVFQGNMTPIEVVNKLLKGGEIEQIKVTIPEGLNIWATGKLLEKKGLSTYPEFIGKVTDVTFIKNLGLSGKTLEGYIYPDTYFFIKGKRNLEAMIKRFVNLNRRVFDRLKNAHNESYQRIKEEFNFSDSDFIIMASLIEKESGVVGERRKIASVFYNRLKKKMRLQTDPTCIYGETVYTTIPTKALCNDEKSSYSTYVIDGLPPTPIASPGKTAIIAALNPETTEYLYFCSKNDKSKTHVFSKSEKEHFNAVNQYLRKK